MKKRTSLLMTGIAVLTLALPAYQMGTSDRNHNETLVKDSDAVALVASKTTDPGEWSPIAAGTTTELNLIDRSLRGEVAADEGLLSRAWEFFFGKEEPPADKKDSESDAYGINLANHNETLVKDSDVAAIMAPQTKEPGGVGERAPISARTTTELKLVGINSGETSISAEISAEDGLFSRIWDFLSGIDESSTDQKESDPEAYGIRLQNHSETMAG